MRYTLLVEMEAEDAVEAFEIASSLPPNLTPFEISDRPGIVSFSLREEDTGRNFSYDVYKEEN